MMRIAGIQHDIAWENRDANFERLRPLIYEAAESDPDLIVLTELFSTGFSMNTEMIGESYEGPSASFLVDEAEKVGIPICGSIPLIAIDHTKPHNCLFLAHPDKPVDRYSKKHLFSFAEEHKHYRSGDKPLRIDLNGVSISFFICFDLRFAPDFWELAPTTDLYVVIANWPEARSHHWKSLLVARAIENQAYVMGVNRVGVGNGIGYSGDSRLIGPLGEEVLIANPNEIEILIGEVDPHTVSEVRREYPFLSDRLK
jgi:predicted amidohydrolase